MSIKALQDYTYYSRYARYNKEQKRRNTWSESVDMVRDMHISRFPEVKAEIDEAFELVRQRRVLGSQRALQFAGKPILNKHARIYNCCTSYCDRLRFFQESFWLLLCGCGVGFSVQKHHVAKLPDFSRVDRRLPRKKYLIPDTIEGWADALGILLATYLPSDEFPEWEGFDVEFDYSLIRPAGSSLASSVGKAPGPEPLRRSLEIIRDLLEKCIERGQTRLKTIDAYDIIMHASDAVLSGGVRRCLAAGTRVLVKGKGYCPIEQIVIGDEVSTPVGYRPVTNTFCQGDQNVIRIKHQEGELICTKNHRIAILNDYKGGYRWVAASDLSPGDRLYFPRNIDPGKTEEMPSFVYNKPANSTTCRNIVIPKLDEQIAWLVGLIQGDGYVKVTSKSGVVQIPVPSGDLDLATEATNALKRFGVKVTVLPEANTHGNYFVLRVKSKQLASYFAAHVKQPKTILAVPEFIKVASPRIKMAYVQGVMDADGSVKTRPIQVVVTVYKTFAEEIQCLLQSCGVMARFKTLTASSNSNWKQKFSLVLINNIDKDLFSKYTDGVGFKQVVAGKINQKGNSFPSEFFKGLDLPAFWYQHWCSSNKRMNVDAFSKIFNRSDVVPIEVISTECAGVSKTYDIEVSDGHCFVAQGVLVHNSATICLFSPEDEEMAKAKTGNWFVDNPQRGRSNNSAMLLRNSTTREQFSELMRWVKECGEPGFIWTDSLENTFNPCFHRDTRILTEKGYRRIGDLYREGESIKVVADNRPGKGDELDIGRRGVSLRDASRISLTQKNAIIYEVETSHGHILRVTDNHEFPTLRGRLKLKDMLTGDKILLQSGEGVFGEFGTFDQGLLLGLVTGDGCFCGEHAWMDVWESDFDQCSDILKIVNSEISKVSSNGLGGRSYDELVWMNQTSKVAKKRIGGRRFQRFFTEILKIEVPKTIKDRVPEVVWNGSRDFVRGYLQGFFATDGSVQMSGHAKKSTVSLRLTQANRPLLADVQAILGNFGIVSRIYSRRPEGMRSLPNGKGGNKEYLCKECFELVVSRPNAIAFDEQIGLFGHKSTQLKTVLEMRGKECGKPERFITSVKSIKYWGQDDVFCLKQFDTNTVIANGCVVGQCVEISLYPVCPETGKSGWAFCNLCEINGRKIKTKEDFALAARGAAIIGTLQASYTDFAYLGDVSKRIAEQEALLGVSITGMMDNPSVIFDPEIQKEMARLVVETNEEFAPKIGIRASARSTCVKPAGSTSCVLGTSSGIHPHHAKRYLRRVQGNTMEAPLQYYKGYNPRAVETSVWSANGTDEVVTFLIDVPEGARTKNQMDAISLLEHVKTTQQNWVEYGKVKERCTQPWLCHNVSNTINVRPEEWDKVEEFIYDNRRYFAGIALLPHSGDLDYPQAPMCTVHTPFEIIKTYGEGSIMASGLIVDGLRAFGGNLWKACDAVLGLGESMAKPEEPDYDPDGPDATTLHIGHYQGWGIRMKEWEEKMDWVRRAQQFADRYFKGDRRQMCYCLKEVNNWKLWCDLKREHVDVDYEKMIEYEDNTKVHETISCSGGKCEII